jgi:hypothetical protein
MLVTIPIETNVAPGARLAHPADWGIFLLQMYEIGANFR